jgi:hypothetical protein
LRRRFWRISGYDWKITVFMWCFQCNTQDRSFLSCRQRGSDYRVYSHRVLGTKRLNMYSTHYFNIAPWNELQCLFNIAARRSESVSVHVSVVIYVAVLGVGDIQNFTPGSRF